MGLVFVSCRNTTWERKRESFEQGVVPLLAIPKIVYMETSSLFNASVYHRSAGLRKIFTARTLFSAILNDDRRG